MLGEYEDRENAKRPAQLKNRDERKGIMHTNHHWDEISLDTNTRMVCIEPV